MDANVKFVLQKLNKSVNESPELLLHKKISFSNKLDDMVLKYSSIPVKDEGSCKSELCRPWNYQDYVGRLVSFRDSSKWFAKPECLNPLQCALHGWSCSQGEVDTLVCFCCNSKITHISKDDPQGTVTQKLLESAHSQECGWYVPLDVAETVSSRALLPSTEQLSSMSCCDPSFMDVPSVQSDLLLSRSILQCAAGLISAFQGVCNSGGQHSRALVVRSQNHHITVTSTLNDKSLEELKRSVSSSSGVKPGNIAATGTTLLWQMLIGYRSTSPALAVSEEMKLSATVLLLAACGWEVTAPSATHVNLSPAPTLLGCRLCGRFFSLSQLHTAASGGEDGGLMASTGLDCVSQHRYFCPYVNAPTRWPLWCCENHSLNVSAGSASWQLGICALARVFGVAKAEATTPLKKRNNELKTYVEDTQVENNMINVNSDSCALSPEQAYKRIRGILNESVAKPSV